MSPRRWIAWKLAQLAHRTDPSAYWTQEVQVMSRLDDDPTHTLIISADAFHGGMDSASVTPDARTLPWWVRFRDNDEPWETL